jgi:hypothetical protein
VRRSLLDTPRSLLLCVTLAAGCGGGSGGGRPATVVAGNVRSISAGAASATRFERLWRLVRAWWSAQAVAQVPGITVAIVGSGNSTTTDEQGLFRLEGNQFGPTAIQFTGNGADASFGLTLPAGGEVDLIDVDVTGSQVKVAQQRIQLSGPITGIDCGAQLLQVLSGSQVPFRVRLTPTTSIVDQNGAALGCIDLVIGHDADVAGTVLANGDVSAVLLTENPPAGGTAQTTSLTATVVSTSCPTSIVVSGDQGDVQVSLRSSTTILDSNGQALPCSGLVAGDTVQVEGEQTAFGISATQIDRLAPTPTPTPTAGPA